MKWASLADFLGMGGYGLYVWGSYVVTIVLIAIEVIALAVRQRQALQHAGELLPESKPPGIRRDEEAG
jgi:heme exporter protein D